MDQAGHPQTKTFRIERSAVEKQRSIELDKMLGKRVDRAKDSQKYGDLAETWLRARRNLTPKVRGNYRYRLDRQLLPFWASTRIENIDADTVSG